MLTTFWDLEEKERAALTSEEVERFLDAELMTKGVLKVMPLVLDEEPTIKELDVATYYFVGGISNVVFDTAQAAEKLVELRPLTVGSEYYRHSVKYARTVGDLDIGQVRLAPEVEFTVRRSDLEKRGAARAANEKRREQYDKDYKAQSKVLEGVWDDWNRCRRIADGHRRIVATFNDYVKTAGDRDIAASFLAKVFSVAAIAEAAEWCGVEIPTPVVDGQFQEAEPMKVATSDDLSF